MQHRHDIHAAAYHLASLLDELSAGCDDEFDDTYEELEREFAELRLQFVNR
jgi:hypothetical protein